jgi:peroxiredoxin
VTNLAQLAQIAVIALGATFVYSFVTAAREGEQRRVCTTLCHMSPDYAARNRLAPDFELSSLDGKPVKLSDYRGKTVVLNFWTKTCRPCLEEMPSVAELARILHDRGSAVVVTVTTDESAEDARATLQSVLGGEAPFVTLVDSDSDVVAGKFGTKLFPETWIVDPKGVIRARFDGPRDWSTPLAVDLAESYRTPISCSLQFDVSAPSRESAAVCERITG